MKDGPQAIASAVDPGTLSSLATLTIGGRNTGQAGRLTATDRAELGQLSEQGRGQNGSGADQGTNDLCFSRHGFVVCDGLSDAGVDQLQPGLGIGRGLLDQLAQARFTQMLEPAAGLVDDAHQHVPDAEELREFTGLFGTARQSRLREVLTVTGDQVGIDRIGFGQDPHGLGEATYSCGIEQLHTQAFGFQRLDDRSLVVATGFQGDSDDAGLVQPTAQFTQTATVAADGEDKIARQDMNVEFVLADVDAGNRYNVRHLRDPFLAYGGRHRAAVRALRRDEAGSRLRFGVCLGSTEDLNGLRFVGAGGVAFSSRVSAQSGASSQTCKDLTPATEYPVANARSFAALRMTPKTRSNLVHAGTRAVVTALGKHGLRGRRLKDARPLDSLQDPLAGDAFLLKPGVAVAGCPEGGVVVIEGNPVPPLPVAHFAKRGIAGVLSAVPLRQADELVRAPLPGFQHKGGVAIAAGDAILGDKHGVVVIPEALADQIAEEAADAVLFEEFNAEQVNAGGGVYGLHIPMGDQAKRAFAEWKRMRRK